MNGSKLQLLGPEKIKGIVLADHKKRNFISIHEMVLFAFKYIFWPIFCLGYFVFTIFRK